MPLLLKSNKISLAVIVTMISLQNTNAKNSLSLEEIQVKAQNEYSADLLSQGSKTSDIQVSQHKLQRRSGTLGNALSEELSVHSNPFGGGSSTPIIRGQEGVRVKILQGGMDSVDMSTLSPDHAVAVDTLLADKVEILRGASTLLYSTASTAGVVNVLDQRIPRQMPANGISGDLNLRYNQNSRENTQTLGTTLGLGKHLALRLEGLNRHSQSYMVKEFTLGNQRYNYVPDTQNRSKVGNVGLSFISEKGFIGASYSDRRDKYGIPGHNHGLDNCAAHIYGENQDNEYYLSIYPHLMTDKDLIGYVHTHCSSGYGTTHDHAHPYGAVSTAGGPWIQLQSKRYDIKSEFNNPIKSIEKIRLSIAKADYYHDERDDTEPVNLFNNEGKNARLEIVHSDWHNLRGAWGVQYQTQESSAFVPRLARDPNHYRPSKFTKPNDIRWALIGNKNRQISFFGIEQLYINNFLFEVAGRTEQQKIFIDYDRKRLAEAKKSASGEGLEEILVKFFGMKPNPKKEKLFHPNDPDLSLYKERANSYLGAMHWSFTPHHTLSLTYSHNERFPTPMELYYHGKHLATNSLEHGNNQLKKERSDNVEISLAYTKDAWYYALSSYYSQFKNHIFNQTLRREGDLSLNRYTQSKAKFYGIESKIRYDFSPKTQITLWGDYVRGKLYALPPTTTFAPAESDQVYMKVPQADRNAPRVPPLRLGVRLHQTFGYGFSGDLDYTHVFSQHKVTENEKPTQGYRLLNLGLNYEKSFNRLQSELYINFNNLLDEKIYNHSSFLPFVPQIGRNIVMGLNVEF